MADHRRTLVLSKIFYNLLFPIYPVVERGLLLSPLILLYILQAAVPVLASFYIGFKKAKYSRVFLRRVYMPSNRLFLVMAGFELPFMAGMYCYLAYARAGVLIFCAAAAHLLLTLCVYLYACAKASRYKVRINSFDNNFKLGVMGVQIGEEGERGLEKGEIVKIVKRQADGYLVKNSKGEEFIVKLSDIEEIIDIV